MKNVVARFLSNHPMDTAIVVTVALFWIQSLLTTAKIGGHTKMGRVKKMKEQVRPKICYNTTMESQRKSLLWVDS